MLIGNTMKWVSVKHGKLEIKDRKLKIKDRVKERPPRPTYIYVFWLGFTGMYKIGRSNKWEKRLESFKIANPFVKPVLVIAGDCQLENKIHKDLEEYKHEMDGHNEIFVFDDKKHIIKFIKGLASMYRVIYLDDAFKREIDKSKYK